MRAQKLIFHALDQSVPEAISQNDPEQADRAMRQHIRYGSDNIVRAMGPNTIQRVK